MALPAPPRQRRHEERFQQQHVAKQRRAECRRAARIAKALEDAELAQRYADAMQSTATTARTHVITAIVDGYHYTATFGASF